VLQPCVIRECQYGGSSTNNMWDSGQMLPGCPFVSLHPLHWPHGRWPSNFGPSIATTTQPACRRVDLPEEAMYSNDEAHAARVMLLCCPLDTAAVAPPRLHLYRNEGAVNTATGSASFLRKLLLLEQVVAYAPLVAAVECEQLAARQVKDPPPHPPLHCVPLAVRLLRRGGSRIQQCWWPDTGTPRKQTP